MKIINKKEKFSTYYGDIGCGEIFECDGVYWMKVYNVCKDEWHAVCLANGEIEEFELADTCKVVNAELHILD